MAKSKQDMQPRFFVNFGKFAETAPAAADPALSNSKARPRTGLALPSFPGQAMGGSAFLGCTGCGKIGVLFFG